MMNRCRTALLAVALAFVFGPLGQTAQAGPVDVTYSVSGSAGNWTYDFAVTNNLADPSYGFTNGNTYNVYALVITSLPNATPVGSPAGWAPTGPTEWCANSGNCFTFSGISAGQTLGGFQMLDSSATLADGVGYFIAAISTLGPSQPNFNPVFTGTATVPAPGALALLGLGLIGVGGLRRKKLAA